MWESEHRHGTDANSVSVVSECVVELSCCIDGCYGQSVQQWHVCSSISLGVLVYVSARPVLHLLAIAFAMAWNIEKNNNDGTSNDANNDQLKEVSLTRKKCIQMSSRV